MRKLVKRIHVNQHKIRHNKKTGENVPVLTCKTSKTNDYGHTVIIYDKDGNEAARVIYTTCKPLSCGAHCWVETTNDVDVIETNTNGDPLKVTKV